MTITTDDKDWLLEDFVRYVNGTENNIPITLTVDGFLISGLLVSAHKYLDGARQHIEGRINNEDTKEVTIIKIIDTQISLIAESIKEAAGDWRFGAGFIHLQDAKFHKGNGRGLKKQKGVFWRGQIDKVSGFYLE